MRSLALNPRGARPWAATLSFLMVALGCGDDGPLSIEEQPGCDPLVPHVCAYPMPSMHFMEDDPTTATGHRVAVTAEAAPANAREAQGLLDWINQADGVSRITSFTTVFPDAPLDTSNLPTPFDLEASMGPESPVQLIDMDTGERIPVWAEIEQRGATPAEQALVLRPMRGMPFGHRVAAVITDTLRHQDGAVPASPPAFAALRDGRPTDSDSIERRRPSFDTLFALLEAQGMSRDRVVLAWQAVVLSRETAQDALPAMVELAAAGVDTNAPELTITACYSHAEEDRDPLGLDCALDDPRTDAPLNPLTWRRIFGEVALPNFLGPDGRVTRDAAGQPVQQGTVHAEFVVNVPASLRGAGEGAAPLVTFGHGLLMDPGFYIADDDDYNGQMVLADRLGAIFIGTRWTGLSSTDLGQAAGVILDPDTAPAFADTLMQGIVHQILMVPFVEHALMHHPLLSADDGSGSLVDPTRLGYTGISQGGIYGTTLMALSPYVQTGVLHVPASGYVHLLPHSTEFATFQALLDAQVPDLHEQQVFFAFGQRVFDAGDPINHIAHVVDDPLTPLGPKNALWQCAVGDMLAPWFGCDALMRTGGIPTADPEVWPVWGLDPISTPTAPGASALQYFDPQLGVPELTTADPQSFGAHTALRRNDEIHAQHEAFFAFDDPPAAGTIIDPCDGPCVIDPVPAE
jgi:hypothetical protein